MTARQALAQGIRDAVDFGPFLIVNGKSSLDMMVSPNVENKVTLNVTSTSTKDEIVTMKWTLFNQSGGIVKVLEADFVVKGNKTQSSEEPNITMNYINNQKNFDYLSCLFYL